MLIKPQLFMAGRCPHCQEYLLYRPLSLFALKSGRVLEINCGCGAKAFEIYSSGKKHLYLNGFCPYCVCRHDYVYSLSALMNGGVFVLPCLEADLHLAYIGQREAVLGAMAGESDIILDYAENLTEYFARPLIMAKSLNKLHNLILDDAVRCSSCQSGNLNLLIQNRRVIVSCNDCDSAIAVSAHRPSDLKMLNRTSSILLGRKQSYFHFSAGKNLPAQGKNHLRR